MFSLLWVLLFHVSTSGAQSACSEIFSAPQSSLPASLLKQGQPLFPQTELSGKSLSELYFLVLETYERASNGKEPLPESFLNSLKEHFTGRYEMPTAASDLKTFYQNALHAYYGRIAWEWKKQTLETLTGTSLSGRELTLAQALMDSFFSFGGMGADTAKSLYVRETLERQEWVGYPWNKALEIFRAWEKSEDAKAGFFGFYRWLERHPELPTLTSAELERLYLAISKTTKNYSYVHCCKSSFACMTCPHNRKWLKE